MAAAAAIEAWAAGLAAGVQARAGCLGVAGQPQFPAIGRRQMNIDHLHGSEFLQSAARGQSAGQGVQAALQRDLQAVHEERDEDVSLECGARPD